MYFLVFVFFLTSAAFGKSGETFTQEFIEEGLSPENAPWFTGPLLTPSSHIVPYGSCNIEPYIFATIKKAVYKDNWETRHIPTFISINSQLSCQIGISKNSQFSFTPQFYYRKTQRRSSLHFGDLPTGFDFQLYREKPRAPWPTIKYVIRETFPTGTYQRLEPKNLGTDATGSGSFATTTGFVFGKLYDFGSRHYLNTRLELVYSYFAPVHVRGFNNYGGGYKTAGTVYPGNRFIALLGLEYSITRNWVLALDVQEEIDQKIRFKGQRGFVTPGIKATVGNPPANQISLAPAIEYNFDAANGIIGGAWFTVAGRNSSQFVSWVIAYNYYK